MNKDKNIWIIKIRILLAGKIFPTLKSTLKINVNENCYIYIYIYINIKMLSLKDE